jgi:hypothetical protein
LDKFGASEKEWGVVVGDLRGDSYIILPRFDNSHGAKSWREIIENHPLYEEYGLPVELYPAEEVPSILPLVDNLEGIEGLSVSRKAGLIDHYSLREFYRGEARKNGVRFFDRCYAARVSVEMEAKEVTAYDMARFDKDRGPWKRGWKGYSWTTPSITICRGSFSNAERS